MSWTAAQRSRASSRPALGSRSILRRNYGMIGPITCCCSPGTFSKKSSGSRRRTVRRAGSSSYRCHRCRLFEAGQEVKFVETGLAGAWLVEIEASLDERGLFARTYCEREFAEHGIHCRFVQCSTSYNRGKHTLRG